jgi:hypothetical protein
MFHWFAGKPGHLSPLHHPNDMALIGSMALATSAAQIPIVPSVVYIPVILWVRTVAGRGAGGGADIIQVLKLKMVHIALSFFNADPLCMAALLLIVLLAGAGL